MSVIKRGNSKYYYYQFRINGKTYLGSTKTTNRAKALQVEAKKRSEVHAQLMLGESEPITLSDALSNYAITKKGTPNHRNITVHSRKLQGYRLHNKTQAVLPCYGFDPNKQLDEITSIDLERLVQHRRDEGLGEQAIKHELNVIRGATKHARKTGYKTNPQLEYPKLNIKKTRFRHITQEEEQKILDYLNTPINEDNYDFVIMLLDTGMRYSEAAQLPWSSINLEERTITVYRNKVNNESVIHMTDRLYNVLIKRYEQSKPNQRWVFLNKSGDNHRGYNVRAIQHAIEYANLNNEQDVKDKGGKVTVHTFRHTFCSRLAIAGMSLYKIGQLAGHSNTQTTARYAHLTPNDASKEAVSILNSM